MNECDNRTNLQNTMKNTILDECPNTKNIAQKHVAQKLIAQNTYEKNN